MRQRDGQGEARHHVGDVLLRPHAQRLARVLDELVMGLEREGLEHHAEQALRDGEEHQQPRSTTTKAMATTITTTAMPSAPVAAASACWWATRCTTSATA